MCFMTPLASTILAPAIQYYGKEFGDDNTALEALPVSIYLLLVTLHSGPLLHANVPKLTFIKHRGYAIGPLRKLNCTFNF